jgi:Flp pilus assembly protein TadD
MKQARSFGRAYWLTLSLLWPCGVVLAQSFPPGTATVPAPVYTNDPADRLAANLKLLSQNPKDVGILTDAGRSAIAIGDYAAALSFLARAEELAPSNGRVKAAIGSALVMAERPADALRLFAEASALGAPELEMIADRGLAYDLLGDNRRAQRDYQIALRMKADDEITRRYALSLGIAGDRDQALRLLDPLLRQQDPTGWRARAFVLAMNGDVRGAESIASTVMPGGMGDTMRPFLRKLAMLNPAERALAVNFGTMPSDSARFGSIDTSRLIPAPELASASAGEPVAKPVKIETTSKQSRRRPGKEEIAVAATSPARSASPAQVGPGFSDIFVKSAQTPRPNSEIPKPAETARVDQRVGARIGPVDPARIPPEVRAVLGQNNANAGPKITIVRGGELPRPDQGLSTPPKAIVVKAPEPEEIDQATSAVFEVPPVVVAKAQEQPVVAAASDMTVKPDDGALRPGFDEVPAAIIVGAPPEQPQQAAKQPAPVKLSIVNVNPPATAIEPPRLAPATSPGRGLAGLLNDIETEQESAPVGLLTASEMTIAQLAAQRKVTEAANKAKAEKDAAAKAEKAKEEKAAAQAAELAKRNPRRVWVQVATGANESGLGITWKRLREKAPEAFKGLSASYTPFKATNRVLVGPFKSNAEARALVNAMNKAGLSGNSFTSEAGQEILKIAVK